jgi:hypothetical protein
MSRQHRNQLLTSFQTALGSADPVALLLTAEAAGSAVDPSGAPRVAAVAVVNSLGFNLSNYDQSIQQAFIGFVLSQLASLRYLTNGPSLAVPRGNFYNYLAA